MREMSKMKKMESYIEIEGKIIEGAFIKRLTRFSGLIRIGNKEVQAFLPNPGRLEYILKSGAKVVLKKVSKSDRKTSYDLIGIIKNGQKISIDSRIPNKLVFKAIKNKDIKEFSEYEHVKREYFHGDSRLDFMLEGENKKCLLEVKSCTLVKDGVAMFPDAKTERGTRHLKELIKAKREGYRACVLFLIQRNDVEIFSPNDEVDPVFGETLRKAFRQGVEVYAYKSKFLKDKILLKGKVEVKL